MNFETIDELFDAAKDAEENDSYLFVSDDNVENIIVVLTLDQFLELQRGGDNHDE